MSLTMLRSTAAPALVRPRAVRALYAGSSLAFGTTRATRLPGYNAHTDSFARRSIMQDDHSPLLSLQLPSVSLCRPCLRPGPQSPLLPRSPDSPWLWTCTDFLRSL